MEIKLEFVSFLDIPREKNNSAIEVEDGAQVRDVLEELGLDETAQRHITPFVNEEEASRRDELSDGDELFLYLPAGGG